MKFLNRKQIASELGVSVETVRRNEKRFGLRPIAHNKRVILYRWCDFSAYQKKMGIDRE